MRAGSEMSILDITHKIAEIMQIEIIIVNDENRNRPDKSEVFRLFSDISKAKQLINYNPEYCIKRGLTETVEWFKKKII